ncbi:MULTISPECIES: hypothetical protein [unclassified Roseovarius]|uniref:hypothetical protein n=1 Tax=unclassified Roseovarius TaxID=2614913 RepID=UPI00273D7852|nr:MULTISPECIES: hypothetical protein [unclassified Roseovarius]
MTDHKWMIDVLEDLETYAANNELDSLKCLLGEARLKAEIEFRVFNSTKRQVRSSSTAAKLN